MSASTTTLLQRAHEALERAASLCHQNAALRQVCGSERQVMAALRAARRRTAAGGFVRSFTVRGWLLGEDVCATWDAGGLVCDERLRVVAAANVAAGLQLPGSDNSSTMALDGTPDLILLTLVHSLDRMTEVRFDLAPLG
jgi:hypothetical protein